MSGLFDHASEVRTASTIAMVEDVLVTLGHYLNQCRGDAGSWRIRHGSATVEISLVGAATDTHLRVASTVVYAGPTTDRPALWHELLTRNADLCGVAFAVRGDQVLLVAERSTLDLDRTEVHDMIHRTATLADDLDDDLAARHGARRGTGG
jgi:hypothetical protein